MKVILSEGNQVERDGDKVERPRQPWSAHVMRFVQHLEGDGLPVERFIGFEGGKWVSEFADGDMVHPGKWSDDALYGIGRMVAGLHDSARRFVPQDDDIWQPWCLREIGRGERIICHGDIAPWNLITDNKTPKVLVDWEYAGPLEPMVELARVIWLFVQLHDDDLAMLHHLPSPKKRAE
ncbi:MAG: aminoglycoside phosphotransferase family protein [Defluviitaleaceae bacterium]|nr:aminoglycoside phosphotransferase family protein [Defluviitaleaceae bacterium]